MKTQWQLEPSLKFDAVCLLGILSNDPFYVSYYEDDYQRFEALITPPVRTALDDLKAKIKQAQTIISATLALNFSVTPDATIADLLHRLDQPETIQVGMQQTPYYDEADWALFESIIPELRIIFQWLLEIDFAQDWQTNTLPKIKAKIAEYQVKLQDFDIVPMVESWLNKPLDSSEITIYLLYYVKPHGIKITGARFLTSLDYPFNVVVQNAIHEMMHPPYTLDDELIGALDRLRGDEFVMDKVQNHNPDFGYNTFEGYLEENVVQALDQTISEQFNTGHADAAARWQRADDGMHVLAVAIYALLKKLDQPQPIREFLIRAIQSGELAPGNVRRVYEDFYQER